MPQQQILQVEQAIASAHRSIWYAREVADNMTNDTIGNDLNQILVELERMQISLLGNRSRKNPRLSNRTYQ